MKDVHWVSPSSKNQCHKVDFSGIGEYRLIQRLTMAMVIAVGLAVVGVHAEPIVSFSAVPTGYSPGENFSFEIHLSDVQDLAGYNIELVLTATGGTPGSDFFFVSGVKPTSDYVLNPDPNQFLVAIESPGLFDHLTVSDFLDLNTSTAATGTVAIVTVGTSASFTDPLTLSVAPDSLELFDANIASINNFSHAKDNLPSAQLLVPEPGTFGMVLVLLCLGRRRSHG